MESVRHVRMNEHRRFFGCIQKTFQFNTSFFELLHCIFYREKIRAIANGFNKLFHFPLVLSELPLIGITLSIPLHADFVQMGVPLQRLWD
ncbi:MAG: hypothetical protein Q9M45_11420 [Robiginitomaculum sp.]|nr:hypothetical protein [Robiginitomaculum sp.]